MNVEFDGVRAVGNSIDLRGTGVTAGDVLVAVRDSKDDRVQCPEPGPLHEHVGFLHPDNSVSLVAALASAARTWGAESTYDPEIRTIESALQELDASDVDLDSAHRRVAETQTKLTAHRERVATASGEVTAHRNLDIDASEAKASYQTATRKLVTAETEYFAAKEALATAQKQVRDARDARERRLKLEDRRKNLRRDARLELATVFAESFELALAALPVSCDPVPPTDFDGPAWVAAAAIARLARPGAPLVVSEVFECASRARTALNAPILLV